LGDYEAMAHEADDLVNELRSLLSGRDPDIIGAALAQLVATFIAGHNPALRAAQRELLLTTIDNLVPLCVEEMIEAGRAPAEWRGTKQ
jgi:hypothetical protein